MDIHQAYEYINSKTIREYLKSKAFPLSPVQCAFLVWQSRHHTMRQKHEAWQNIIDTMPDCAVEQRTNCRGWDSLHDMLRGYMAYEKKCLSLFQADGKNTFYEYEIFRRWPVMLRTVSGAYRWCGGYRYFRSLAACCRYVLKNETEECCRFRVTKRYLDTPFSDMDGEPYISAEYDASGEMLELYLSGSRGFFSITGEEDALCSESFEGMWFDIPIPFEKGDIVCDSASVDAQKTPFVLMGTVPWYKKEHPPRKPGQNTHSDYSDMVAYGYSYNPSRRFFDDDHRVDYLNLEYYRKPLRGGERLLYAYSQFVKGQIDGYTLLKLAHMIQAEAEAESERRTLSCYLSADIRALYHQEEEKEDE